MSQSPSDPIRLRPDGSIDTAHYLSIAHQRRSEAAVGLARTALRKCGPRPVRIGIFRLARS